MRLPSPLPLVASDEAVKSDDCTAVGFPDTALVEGDEVDTEFVGGDEREEEGDELVAAVVSVGGFVAVISVGEVEEKSVGSKEGDDEGIEEVERTEGGGEE